MSSAEPFFLYDPSAQYMAPEPCPINSNIHKFKTYDCSHRSHCSSCGVAANRPYSHTRREVGKERYETLTCDTEYWHVLC